MHRIIFLLLYFPPSPNKGMTNAEVLSQVEHGYRMPMPPNCTPALYEIMLECWHKVIINKIFISIEIF